MIEKSDHTQRLIISLPEYMYMIAIVLNIFLRSMFNFGRWGTYISYIPIVIMVSYCLYKQSFNYKWFLWLILGITISIGTKSLQCLFIILLIFVSPFIDINKIILFLRKASLGLLIWQYNQLIHCNILQILLMYLMEEFFISYI